MIRQSIFSIGSTFSSDSTQSKKTDDSDENSKGKQEDKKQQKSNGFFDTFFRPLEIKQEDSKSKAKPEVQKPSASKAKDSPKKSTNEHLESADDFFSKNLGDIDRSGRSTMAMPAPSSIVIPNISSIDVFNYYKEKPKELTKLFHQIGKQMMSSKDGKSGKWIQDIIKEYVSLLLYSTYTYEELLKLDRIKHYFALKIEKVIEEKKDWLRSIESLQFDIKKEQKVKDEAKEEERIAKVKLMEKSTEFTVRIKELLKISDERDHALKLAENADKKLKETKKVI